MKDDTPKLKPTPINKVYPQLWAIGQVLGMKMYIEVDTKKLDYQRRYDLALKLLSNAFNPPQEDES